jgi:hypothetical protein
MSQDDQEERQPGERQGEEEEQEGEDEILVACRCESAKAVATLLHCLRHVASSSGGGGGPDGAGSAARDLFATQSHGSSRRPSHAQHAAAALMQPVTVYCSPSSLTFHLYGRAKQMQASVDLQKSLFSHYQVVASPDHSPSQADEGGEAWHGSGGEFCVNLTKVRRFGAPAPLSGRQSRSN